MTMMIGALAAVPISAQRAKQRPFGGGEGGGTMKGIMRFATGDDADAERASGAVMPPND